MIDADKRNFTEIENRISKIKETCPNRNIWQMIKTKPITTNSIDYLVETGWSVILNNIESSCNTNKKIIKLEKGIDNFQRDKFLFHEICHAWYGEELSDRWLAIYEYDNRIIAEWLARQLRANPKLLRHTIFAFDLEPKIYDKISYEAFSNPAQLVFPFAEIYYERFKKILM